MKITISSGSFRRTYSATSGRHAVQRFFDQVRAGQIEIADLGAIGHWADAKDEYPFRIMPALYSSGLITRSQMDSLHKLAGLRFTTAEVDAMVSADAWMVRDSDAGSALIH